MAAIATVERDDEGHFYARGGGTLQKLQRFRRRRGLIRRPSGFLLPRTYWDCPIIGSPNGVQIVGFHEEHLIPASVRYTSNVYWVSTTGNDSTGDGSFATPWRGIDKALATATYPCIINVLPGLYDQANSWNGTVPGGDCWVRRHGLGEVISAICWADAITISQVGSTTVWRANRSNAVMVVDRINFDDAGEPLVYTYTSTNAAVAASSGGFWSNDGGNTTIDIKRVDGLQVTTANTSVLLSGVSNGKNPTSGNIFVSGIKFWGGNIGAFRCTGNATGVAAFADCAFNFAGRESSPQDGFQALEIAMIIGVRVTAAKNSNDGFNHTPTGSGVPHGVYIDRLSHRNGGPGALSNNGLTAHNGSMIIDIRGCDEYNRGGNVAAKDAGTQIWCIDHVSKYSQGDLDLVDGSAVPGTYPSTAYQVLTGGELFLDGCGDVGSVREMSASGGGVIWTRDHEYGGGSVTGDVRTY